MKKRVLFVVSKPLVSCRTSNLLFSQVSRQTLSGTRYVSSSAVVLASKRDEKRKDRFVKWLQEEAPGDKYINNQVARLLSWQEIHKDVRASFHRAEKTAERFFGANATKIPEDTEAETPPSFRDEKHFKHMGNVLEKNAEETAKWFEEQKANPTPGFLRASTTPALANFKLSRFMNMGLAATVPLVLIAPFTPYPEAIESVVNNSLVVLVPYHIYHYGGHVIHDYFPSKWLHLLLLIITGVSVWGIIKINRKEEGVVKNVKKLWD